MNDWKKTMDINVNGVFYSIQAASKYMLEKGKGSVIITSSISGHLQPSSTPMCLQYLQGCHYFDDQGFGYRVGHQGIRVNAICPGYMRTELLDITLKNNPEWERQWNQFTPMGRVGEAKELRGAVVFLASDASFLCYWYRIVR